VCATKRVYIKDKSRVIDGVKSVGVNKVFVGKMCKLAIPRANIKTELWVRNKRNRCIVGFITRMYFVGNPTMRFIVDMVL